MFLSAIAMNLRSESRFNAFLAHNRRLNANGLYDTHTNMMLYPKIMQPTHARWEELPTPLKTTKSLEILPRRSSKISRLGIASGETVQDLADTSAGETIFSDMAPIFTRNYMITDTYYLSPSSPGLGYPGPDGDVHDIDPNGLTKIQDDVLAELPGNCRQAFDEAKLAALRWKHTWGLESEDRARGELRISYNS